MARRGTRGGRTTPKGTRPQDRHRAPARQQRSGEELLLEDAAWALDQGLSEMDHLASVVASMIEPAGQGRERVFDPGRLLQTCRRAGDRSGLLVARAIALLGRPKVAERAQRVAELIEGSVDEADRARIDAMGRVEPTSAFSVTDPHHDATAVYLQSRRPDGENVAVRMMCEAAFRGAATEFDYGISVSRARSNTDATVEDVSLADARAWLEHALAMRETEFVIDPDDERDLTSLENLPIVVHYFRQCPDGGDLPPRAELTDPSELPALVDEFLSSHHADRLANAAVVAPELAQFCMELSGQPLWWSPAVADMFGQYASQVFGDDVQRDLIPVAKAWASWAGRKLGKGHRAVADTLDAIDRRLGPDSPAPTNLLTLPGLDTGGHIDGLQEEDWLLEAWARHEAKVSDLVRDSLDTHRGSDPPPAVAEVATTIREGISSRRWPYDTLAELGGETANGVTAMTDRDVVLWAASVMIDPDPDLDHIDPDDIESLTHPLALSGTLDPIDWAQLVISLVRQGAGTSCRPADLTELLTESQDDSQDDVDLVEQFFEANRPLWQAAGVTDTDDDLTPLGVWALPRVLCRALGTSFD